MLDTKNIELTLIKSQITLLNSSVYQFNMAKYNDKEISNLSRMSHNLGEIS